MEKLEFKLQKKCYPEYLDNYTKLNDIIRGMESTKQGEQALINDGKALSLEYKHLGVDEQLSLAECIFLVTDVFDVSHQERESMYNKMSLAMKVKVITIGIDTLLREDICDWYKKILENG